MKILIAEDRDSQARLLGSLVRYWGYEPVIVHDGKAALEALRSPEAPRLVLLDWELPGLDGPEVCRELRKKLESPYTYVILLTGRGKHEDKIHGLEAGADDFLTKPANEAELKARLNAGRRIVTLQEQLLAAQRRLQEQATRDALTRVWNRAAILEILSSELVRASREGTSVGVLLVDIDHFKQINDTHGHLTGDQVLHQAAQRMQGCLRPYDSVGRYGGEEFLVVLPGCDPGNTMTLAERLRNVVGSTPVDLGSQSITATISLGAINWSGTDPDAISLLRAADEALYRAKHAGRDRAVFGGQSLQAAV